MFQGRREEKSKNIDTSGVFVIVCRVVLKDTACVCVCYRILFFSINLFFLFFFFVKRIFGLSVRTRRVCCVLFVNSLSVGALVAALKIIVVFRLTTARIWHNMTDVIVKHSGSSQRSILVFLAFLSFQFLGDLRLWVVVDFLEAQVQVLVAGDEVVSAAVTVDSKTGDVTVAASLGVAVVVLFSAALSFSLSSGFSVSAVVVLSQGTKVEIFSGLSILSRFLDDIVVRLRRVLEAKLGLVPSSWWWTHCVVPRCDEVGQIDRADCVVLDRSVVGAFSASDGGIGGSDKRKSFHEHFIVYFVSTGSKGIQKG